MVTDIPRINSLLRKMGLPPIKNEVEQEFLVTVPYKQTPPGKVFKATVPVKASNLEEAKERGYHKVGSDMGYSQLTDPHFPGVVLLYDQVKVEPVSA